jgi:hypothetical protein
LGSFPQSLRWLLPFTLWRLLANTVDKLKPKASQKSLLSLTLIGWFQFFLTYFRTFAPYPTWIVPFHTAFPFGNGRQNENILFHFHGHRIHRIHIVALQIRWTPKVKIPIIMPNNEKNKILE